MVWKIILGIILFIILVLSVKVKILVHSEDGIDLSVGWLFLKFQILPKKEKDEKKPKKEKKKKEKEETEEVKEPKEKKENIFIRFYRNNGVDGVVELLQNLKKALGGMFRRIGRAFLFEQIYIYMQVSSGDSADTAVKYGKVCSAAYPAMGFFVANMRVKKSNLQIVPNFVNGESKAKVHTKISVRPIKLINALIVVGVQLTFKVLIKFLKGAKAPKAEPIKEENINK